MQQFDDHSFCAFSSVKSKKQGSHLQ
jgi:hypothetical protein